jgi:hypothetical protein
MKKLLSIGFIVAILASCGAPKYAANPYSTSTLLKHDTQGILTLVGVSDELENDKKGSGKEKAEAASHQKALRQLFYMGFPGSDFKNPLIMKGQSIETQHSAFFSQFWATGYKQFITDNSVEFTDCKETRNCIKAISTFKVNYNQLRRHLEQNKVLNKIGF